MRNEDFKAFSQVLDAACSMLSRGNYTPNATAAALFFKTLTRHDFATVEAAFGAHISDPVRGKFPPVPADILAQIEGMAQADGRPAQDEAWAHAMRAQDENATVVWTSETAEAYGIARVVLDAGDEVGGRMAFKAAYARLVEAARANRAPIKWEASLGHNKAEQQQALQSHIALGRLPAAMLEYAGPAVTLLELANSPDAPAKARESLLAIREAIIARSSNPGEVRRDGRTDALKAAALAQFETYQQEAHP